LTRRTDRINEQLRSEIARILRTEVTDPRVRLVSLTRVDVSPDLRNARVLWSVLDKAPMPDDDQVPDADPDVQDGLDSAAGFVRRRLAQALPLKRVPALQFHFDP
jgi:ribosome-binding factor A